ncbi:hypothetical protein D044_3087B, partial [Vibrio parahaemolyticus EKP-026]
VSVVSYSVQRKSAQTSKL